MKKCPYCFTELNDRALVCSGCRKEVGAIGRDGVAKKYTSPVVQGCLGICILCMSILVICIIVFGLTGLFEDRKKQKVKTDFEKAVEIARMRLPPKTDDQKAFDAMVEHIRKRRICSLVATKFWDETNKGLIMGKRVAGVPGMRLQVEQLWYYKNGVLYCVNGAAKEVTPDIPYTYEIDPLTAFKPLDYRPAHRSAG